MTMQRDRTRRPAAKARALARRSDRASKLASLALFWTL